MKTIRKKTRGIRHWVVKLIAPTLYQRACQYFNLPRAMARAMGSVFQDKLITGVEIGVSSGRNANTILSFLNIRRLYLVDPYENCLDRMINARYQLSRFSNKTVFIRKKSHEAIGNIPDNLDFVYIDGPHDYENVKNDIRLYYDKVKSGGLLGGHNFSPNYPGVIKAVKEFTKDKGLTIHGEQSLNIKKGDWWVVKP